MARSADDASASDKPFLPRWVRWLALPAAAMPVAILAFVVKTEFAYDETRCPYREVRRAVVRADIVVIEHGRRCTTDTEERRWTLVRAGRSQVLGLRRLGRAAFASDRYRWSAALSEQGEVRVTVENPGVGEVLLREGTPEEHARDGR